MQQKTTTDRSAIQKNSTRTRKRRPRKKDGSNSPRSFREVVGDPTTPLNRSLMGVAPPQSLVEVWAALPHVEKALVQDVFGRLNRDAGLTVEYFLPHCSSPVLNSDRDIVDSKQVDPFIDFPTDLALKVFEFLEQFELGGFARISRECRCLVKHAFSDVRRVGFNSVDARGWSDERILKKISSFPKLELVNLKNCESFFHFSLLPQYIQDPTLKHLNLTSCSMLTDDDIAVLAPSFPCLESLNLSKTPISDLGLDYLTTRCSNLKTLILQECNAITDSGLQYFTKKYLTLETLNLNKTKIDPNRLVFPPETHLFQLEMNNCERFQRLSFTSEYCVLQVLNLSFSSAVYVEIALSSLQVLNFSSSKLLTSLSLQTPQLTTLNLSQCKSLCSIRDAICPRLSSLNLFMCRSLDSKCLGELVSSCGQSLNSLNATGTTLRHHDVEHILGQCKVLRSFKAEGCKELPQLCLEEIAAALHKIHLHTKQDVNYY